MTWPLRPRWRRGRLRVVIVAPLLARHDAISATARDTYGVLAAEPDVEVLALTYRNDFPEVRSRTVNDLSAMLLDPVFLAADIIIYQFGIYASLFDAILTSNGKARQIVCFHNITPAGFLGPECRPVIERSYRQIENLRRADEIWCVSQVNAEVLTSRGFDTSRVRIVPLPVEVPALALLGAKRTSPVELLFVGRIVQSKGVLDLIRAVERMYRRTAVPFRLRIAGNREWSDQTYLTQVEAAIVAGSLGHVIEVVGTVDDAELERLYHEAHVFTIPSYHEGFCKPVIEALRAGCVPIGYSAYNLPYIANGFGRMVPPGDVKSMAEALREIIEGVAYGLAKPAIPTLPVDRGLLSVAAFDVATKAYVQNFSLSRYGRTVVTRIYALCRHLVAGDAAAWHIGCADSSIAGVLHKLSLQNQ